MTAVEWLEISLLGLVSFDSEELRKMYKDRIAKAKEMERQQIIMAFWNSKHSLCDEDTDLLYLAEQYYNKKFKNK